MGSWRIPLEACPELETPAAPYVLTLPAVRVQPSARITASASATGSISELNLRGLLPCYVRFAPTGHPVNGNTGYRPAGSLWPGGTRTRWIPLRGFTGSFQLLLFQAFPNAICHASTCFRIGSEFRCIRSTPIEMQSVSENDFECLASTGVNTPETMLPSL